MYDTPYLPSPYYAAAAGFGFRHALLHPLHLRLPPPGAFTHVGQFCHVPLPHYQWWYVVWFILAPGDITICLGCLLLGGHTFTTRGCTHHTPAVNYHSCFPLPLPLPRYHTAHLAAAAHPAPRIPHHPCPRSPCLPAVTTRPHLPHLYHTTPSCLPTTDGGCRADYYRRGGRATGGRNRAVTRWAV